MSTDSGNGQTGTIGTKVGAGAVGAENGAMPPRKFLSRDAILSAQDITFEDVVVPEWSNGIVRVKALTAGQRDALESSCMVQEGKKQVFKTLDFRAKLVVRTACDENLRLLFAGDADVPSLTAKAAGPVNRLAEVAMRLSRITEEDVDDLVKSSGQDRSGASSSVLPSSDSGSSPVSLSSAPNPAS